ncbi:hypothetical protein [Spiroplasma poulsonii]|uniref:hypothetical protein n=1 Tax=Spiroplasma poulsonii TaxID=2138 RepID=UPI000D670C5F|nr:hypothetical protein [Spiroplasma poulsonii]PWF95602.1 hypothetical protein SMSE_10370 [Spiroplasma poulsonii]
MTKLNLLEQIKSNEELMLNLQAIAFDVNDYEKFSSLFEEYLNNYHYCESSPNLLLCQQQFKGYKYYFKKKLTSYF